MAGLRPTGRRLLVSGDGALMQGLEQRLPGRSAETNADFGAHPESVEATGFAWFAYQTLSRLSGSVSEVTGADGPKTLGAIYPV